MPPSSPESLALPSPSLALHTNIMNGRAFAEPPSPAFEVLPSLARSVLQVLSAGAAAQGGVRVGSLAAYSEATETLSSDQELTRSDLLDLLELLLEHGVVVRVLDMEPEEDKPRRQHGGQQLHGKKKRLRGEQGLEGKNL